MPVDSRLKLISNSSIGSLHTCPRKYQLTKVSPDSIREKSVHTEFGKMFGEGLQAILMGAPLEEAVLRAALQWTIDLDEELKDKSFWSAITAIENFSVIRTSTLLADYEVAYVEGKPATELNFSIALPNGYYYRGYIDIVMQHVTTGDYLVVDIKTTGAKYTDSRKFQNSPQAIGYSVVMDKVAPGLSSFDVLYYEYLTGLRKYTDHHFTIGHLQRAQWLRNLVIDTNIMEYYGQYEDWPMHGGSACIGYGRPCQFMDICTMSTASITGGKMETEDARKYDTKWDYDLGKAVPVEYTVEVTFQELVDTQMDKLDWVGA